MRGADLTSFSGSFCFLTTTLGALAAKSARTRCVSSGKRAWTTLAAQLAARTKAETEARAALTSSDFGNNLLQSKDVEKQLCFLLHTVHQLVPPLAFLVWEENVRVGIYCSPSTKQNISQHPDASFHSSCKTSVRLRFPFLLEGLYSLQTKL